MLSRLTLVPLALFASASVAAAQAQAKAATTTTAKVSSYKKDIPDSLARQAKIAEAAAAKTALAKVPKGRIESVELEREDGRLLYSFDIKVAGKSGIEEVRVNAADGSVVGDVEHESPAAEKKEAATEKKETKTPPKAKKPPM